MNIQQVKAALAPDHHSKAAYVGRVKQTETITVTTEDGTAIEREVTIYISWDSMEEMLKLIRNRAGL